MEETPCCPILLLLWHLLMGSAGSSTLGQMDLRCEPAQTLRGLFSEFHAANDYRNDALADCMRTDCNSWFFTGSAAVQHRPENILHPPRNAAVQPLPQVGVTRVTPENLPRATTLLCMEQCKWNSRFKSSWISLYLMLEWQIHHSLY